MKKIFLFLFTVLLLSTVACKKDKINSGNETEGTFTDTRDNNTYKWVKIGTQVWMAENLRYKITTGGCWAYFDNETYVPTYGYLYNWDKANQAIPVGWHMPTDAEWQALKDFLGGEAVAGGKMKEAGTTHWISPNEGATNESKFTALPAGARNSIESYNLTKVGYWWAATEYLNNVASIHFTENQYVKSGKATANKVSGFSVRCIKN